jgi:hypothetical protein
VDICLECLATGMGQDLRHEFLLPAKPGEEGDKFFRHFRIHFPRSSLFNILFHPLQPWKRKKPRTDNAPAVSKTVCDNVTDMLKQDPYTDLKTET